MYSGCYIIQMLHYAPQLLIINRFKVRDGYVSILFTEEALRPAVFSLVHDADEVTFVKCDIIFL